MSKQIFGIDIKDFVKFGKGKEGLVCLTPDKKVLKVYNSLSRCISEYKILKELDGNKHFPKAFEAKGRFLLREYVDGTPVFEYIKDKGLSKRLAQNLIKLAEDFDNLKNIKLDGLDKHIFVLKNEKIMAIDPRRKKYRLYKPLLFALKRMGELDKFLKVLRQKRPDLASKWLNE